MTSPAPVRIAATRDERGTVTMQVAGIREIGAPVVMLEVSEPRPLAPDEVLVEVAAAGVGNWDEFVRTGGWEVGGGPPTALGVEAAGTVLAVGDAVADWSPGDEVMTHPLPLRDQGTWAPRLIAPAALLARKPATVGWEAAAAFPVPALTAEQVISEALGVHAGEQLLVYGAGGVTGGLLVALGTLRGAEVIATAGQASQERVSGLGAQHVIDYHNRDWPEQIRAITGGRGVPAAVNAVPGYAAQAIRAVADDGRLATITSDPPAEERGITVSNVYVRPDGGQLRKLAEQFADGTLTIPIASTYRLGDAAAALVQAISGHAGGAIALRP
jgi:NADPH:quinone reductase-like Zn-dependent oxidoreductase